MAKRKTIKKSTKKTYKQTGKRKSITKDRKRKAKAPGWRTSKSGKKYFENRRNRSDVKGKKI